MIIALTSLPPPKGNGYLTSNTTNPKDLELLQGSWLRPWAPQQANNEYYQFIQLSLDFQLPPGEFACVMKNSQ